MRHEPIDPQLFIDNRQKLAARLKPNSVAVVLANDILPTNADGTLPLYQNADLYWLTGVNQEQTALILAPDAANEKLREVLFLRETSDHIAIWEGHKLTMEEGRNHTGIETIKWTTDFDQTLRDLVLEAEHLYLTTNEHLRADTTVETRNDRFIKQCQSHFPLHHFERLAPHMHELRVVKHPLEVDQLQRACDITEAGFRRVLNKVKPGIMEYEIEAEFLHEFVRSGSRGFAYTPIIGSGRNACVLHYLDNDQPCNDGDMLLMDVAAEYAGYNADMTRTIPVNGTFTHRQKAVYHSVLKVMNEAASMLRPGVIIREYQEEVGKLMESELIDLGLITKKDVADQDPDQPAYKKYFMHGTSHHLGLDVHDVGLYHKPIQAGMVFTVEPGIYIPEENLGIRLENDYLIGDTKNTDLMATIPITPEEIEEAMNY